MRGSGGADTALLGLGLTLARTECEGRLCYDFSAADTFLNSAATKKALGVPAALEWVSCSPYVYSDFVGDWLHRFDTVLPDLLSDGIRVMIYAGAWCGACGGEVCAHVGRPSGSTRRARAESARTRASAQATRT